MKISLITTVYNEGEGVYNFIKSLSCGSKVPDEFVIVDAGSTDNTIDEIGRSISDFPQLNIILICENKINIARGRNIAVNNSSYSVIAVTDAGCLIDKEWLRKITLPILSGVTNHVAGWYKPLCINNFQEDLKEFLFPKYMNKTNFLPSSRSIAFTRDIFDAVNGYPEWLTFAGEDTLFDINIIAKFGDFYCCDDAFVYWEPPRNRQQLLKKYYMYGLGEGEARLYLGKYFLRGLSLLAPFDLIYKVKSLSILWILYLIRLNVIVGYIYGLSSNRTLKSKG